MIARRTFPLLSLASVVILTVGCGPKKQPSNAPAKGARANADARENANPKPPEGRPGTPGKGGKGATPPKGAGKQAQPAGQKPGEAAVGNWVGHVVLPGGESTFCSLRIAAKPEGGHRVSVMLPYFTPTTMSGRTVALSGSGVSFDLLAPDAALRFNLQVAEGNLRGKLSIKLNEEAEPARGQVLLSHASQGAKVPAPVAYTGTMKLADDSTSEFTLVVTTLLDKTQYFFARCAAIHPAPIVFPTATQQGMTLSLTRVKEPIVSIKVDYGSEGGLTGSLHRQGTEHALVLQRDDNFFDRPAAPAANEGDD